MRPEIWHFLLFSAKRPPNWSLENNYSNVTEVEFLKALTGALTDNNSLGKTKATIALDLIREIAEFADYRGCEDLYSAVTKESDILVDLKFETQKQSSLLDFVRNDRMLRSDRMKITRVLVL